MTSTQPDDTPLSSESAHTAAQMATGSNRASTGSRDIEALGPDGKLSAAGAATSLKYARAQDLPSFPSVGIDTATSGNKAASLASSNQKPVEMWKPDTTSSSASRAALLAAKDGGKLDLWQYSPDGTGNSAATLAMGKKNIGPQLDYGYTKEGHQKALLAATKSLSTRDRPEPPTTASPELYPDQANANFNALNAATTVAARPGSALSSADAARIQNMQGVNREMYTERPPVGLEEKRHQEALRASAISMANQLYNLERADVEKSITNPGSVAAERVAAQSYSAATTSAGGDALRMQAMNYTKVQEAAQKLAAERLAKLDPDGVLAYREHYGYGRSSKSASGLLGRGKSSGEPDDSDDEARAAQIKSQMSRFNDQVATVDATKRAQDREALMAAAARNVTARMHTMDEKVFAETGKVPPSLMEEWEAKARAKATADSEERMANHGKVHIGGGKFMDQSEVDAIAAARMQPTLDEINEEAERRRAHEAEVKLDLERHKERIETEKQRERETKAELKRNTELEKEKQRQEKAAEKAAEKAKMKEERDEQKEKIRAERARLDAEKQQAKEEARQLKEQQKQEKLQAEQEKFKAEQERLAEDRERVLATQKEAEERAAPDESTEAAAEGDEPTADKDAAADAGNAGESEADRPSSSRGSRFLSFIRGKKREDGEAAVAEETTREAEEPENEDTPASAEKEEEKKEEIPEVDLEKAAAAIPAGPLVLTTEDSAKDGQDAAPAEPLQLTADPPEAADESKATGEDSTEVTGATSRRRDSRVKSFLGKFKRSSKDGGGVPEPLPLSEKAQGKQPASDSATPSAHDEVGNDEVGNDEEGNNEVGNDEEGNDEAEEDKGNATEASTADVFEEARDKFDSESEAPRASSAEESSSITATKSGSKFQEDL